MAAQGSPSTSPQLASAAHRWSACDQLVFGDDVLARGVSDRPARYALVTQPEPLGQVDPSVRERAGSVALVDSLHEADLDQLVRQTPDVTAVLGVGGGTSMDAAKFLAWRRKVPLLLAPSAVSVDASVTNTIAVRSAGKVEYRGFVVAERVFVDYRLIRGAPARMNRAGAGDLLSIHTALWDWRQGSTRGGADLVPAIDQRAQEILAVIASLAADIQAVSAAGIEAMMRAYAEINDMANQLGHAQLEEGSEHYFAYCLESVTGRSFIHGEAVTMGAVLMSGLQDHEPAWIRAVADATGIRWRAADLGIGLDDVTATLLRLPEFVREAGLPWSVINESAFDQPAILRLASMVL